MTSRIAEAGFRSIMIVALPFCIVAAVACRIWIEVKSIPRYVWLDVRAEVGDFRRKWKGGIDA